MVLALGDDCELNAGELIDRLWGTGSTGGGGGGGGVGWSAAAVAAACAEVGGLHTLNPVDP
jgi:hypothetical protein